MKTAENITAKYSVPEILKEFFVRTLIILGLACANILILLALPVAELPGLSLAIYLSLVVGSLFVFTYHMKLQKFILDKNHLANRKTLDDAPQVKQNLAQARTHFVLTGMGGVGKSAIGWGNIDSSTSIINFETLTRTALLPASPTPKLNYFYEYLNRKNNLEALQNQRRVLENMLNAISKDIEASEIRAVEEDSEKFGQFAIVHLSSAGVSIESENPDEEILSESEKIASEKKKKK